MSSVDNRIVEMKFDNAQFEAGIRQTLSSLATLEKAMKLEGATGGLSNITSAAKKVDLSPIAAQTEQVESRFSIMAAAAAVALGNIATKAAAVGAQVTKSLTLGPMLEGFSDYELKIGATQTIMAGTGESIGFVTKQLKELDIYADETIYSLSDMVNNIGKFTNAGVKLPVAVNAMKGIANSAALAGAGTGEAARAMYNFGQAIGEGHMSLMNWRSVELANMGTKEFKQQLIDGAVAAGTLKKANDGTVKSLEGTKVSFKNFGATLQDKWLTSDVITKVLGDYADKTSDIGKKAYKAAQDVKTFGMMATTLKSAIGTGWTDTFDIIIGDLPEATKMFTDFTNIFGKVISDSANARNKMFLDWDKAGGRNAMIEGLKNGLEAIGRVITVIKTAFREIFPAKTGAQLAEMTKTFAEFMEKIQIGSDTANTLRRTFAGLFAILGIGWEIIKGVAGFFADLFGEMTKGEGSFLKITAQIGDFLVNLHEAIKNGEGLKKFFDGLVKALAVPIRMVKNFGRTVADALGKLNLDKIDVSGFMDKFHPLESLGKRMKSAWQIVMDILDDVWEKFSGMADKFADFFAGFGGGVSNGIGKVDLSSLVSVANIGAVTAIALAIKGVVDGFGDVVKSVQGVVDESKGLVESVKAPFDQLTDTLSAMQNTLRAATLLQIAAAVALLAYSIVKLSQVDADGLGRATKAMAILFVELSIAMAIFQKIKINSGMFQLILLAAAITILADAVVKLAGVDLFDLMKGLAGVYVLLGGIVLATKLMPKGANTIASAAAIVIMAYAIKLLGDTVISLSSMSWEEMARGLAGVAGLLLALGLFTKFAQADKGGVLSGLGIILLAAGIKIMASALKDLGQLSWEEIGRGLAAMAGGLGLMAAALYALPPSSVLSAAAILTVAISLRIIGDALTQMAGMSWEEIGKAMVMMGGSLLLIAAATYAMSGALPGAAALIVVAAAFAILTPVLINMSELSWEAIAKGLVMLGGALLIIAVAMNAMTTAIFGAAALIVVAGALNILLPIMILLGQMSWEAIAKGLIMLAGTFLVIGVAGALLTPVIPTLLGLGLAITLLGVGIAAAGLGLLAFSVGLTALSVAGAAGATALVAIIAAVAGSIPMVMKQVGLGLVEMAVVIGNSAPKFIDAGVKIILALLSAIERTAPKIITTLLVLLTKLLAALAATVPRMVSSGMKLIAGILQGIANNIGKVITAGANLIIKFIDGMGKNLPRIIDAGMKFVIDFVNGVADAVRSNSGAMGEAGGNLASAMVEGLISGINGGITSIASAAKRMAMSAFNAAKDALKINSPSKIFISLGKSVTEGFVKGIDGNKAEIYAAFNDMRAAIKKTIAETSDDMKQAEAKLKKLTSARHKDIKAIKAARAELAKLTAENKKARAADAKMAKMYDERYALGKLANSQDKLKAKLDAANQSLADAIKTRDDYNKAIKDQYDTLPDITAETQLPDYMASLEQQIVDTRIFTAQLQKLRSMGLNDEMYKTLLAKGTAAMPFVEQILTGGQGSVDQLNTLGSALATSAATLANQASTALYQAGVDSAKGIVQGLESQIANIEKQMDKIAAAMVKAIKKALGIKSPSREFMVVGDWSAEGLAAGLEKSSAPMEAAEKVGLNAINSLRKTLTGLDKVVSDEVNLNPTITPILDLTQVKKDAQRMDPMLNVQPLQVGRAYSTAVQASAEYRANREFVEGEEEMAYGRGQSITMVQNNYSPKALSPVDTYRGTRNQISTLKGVLRNT